MPSSLPPTPRGRYTDNIVRVFAHAAAMMLTMGLEIGLFGATPTCAPAPSAVKCAQHTRVLSRRPACLSVCVCFSLSLSVCLCVCVCVPLADRPQLLISATVVGCSVYLYNRATPPATPADSTQPPSPLKPGDAEAAAPAAHAPRRSLVSQWLGSVGPEEPVEQLPPLFPMLTRGADGYSIRNRTM